MMNERQASQMLVDLRNELGLTQENIQRGLFPFALEFMATPPEKRIGFVMFIAPMRNGELDYEDAGRTAKEFIPLLTPNKAIEIMSPFVIDYLALVNKTKPDIIAAAPHEVEYGCRMLMMLTVKLMLCKSSNMAVVSSQMFLRDEGCRGCSDYAKCFPNEVGFCLGVTRAAWINDKENHFFRGAKIAEE